MMRGVVVAFLTSWSSVRSRSDGRSYRPATTFTPPDSIRAKASWASSWGYAPTFEEHASRVTYRFGEGGSPNVFPDEQSHRFLSWLQRCGGVVDVRLARGYRPRLPRDLRTQ